MNHYNRFSSLLRDQGVLGGLALCCLAVFMVFGVGACSVVKKKPESATDELALVGKTIPPERANEILGEVGSNFAYGPGIGSAALNVGTAVVFPPYAVVLLGNAVLSLSGYEPVTVASLLPEEDGSKWSNTYDTVVSGPGRMVAAMAGHEYRSREVADERIKSLLEGVNEQSAKEQTIKN